MTIEPNEELSALLDRSFNQEGKRVVLCEFHGQTCSLCKFVWDQVKYMLKTLPEETKANIELFQIDAMANPQYAIYYGIKAIPTIILFSGGDGVVNDPVRYEKPISIPAIKEKIIEYGSRG